MNHQRPKRATYFKGFWSYVDKLASPTGCWLWLGTPNKAGYGQLIVCGKIISAHKHSYELTHGPIPSGFRLTRVCENSLCVRPDHWDLVSYDKGLESARAARGSKTPAADEFFQRLQAGEDLKALAQEFHVLIRRKRSSSL